jgi:hypothetical protein
MTIALRLTSELEAHVREIAARRGQAVEDYLLSLVERDAARSGVHPDGESEAAAKEIPGWEEIIHRVKTGYKAAPEEEERAFGELLQGIHTGVSLADDDLLRENLYADGC